MKRMRWASPLVGLAVVGCLLLSQTGRADEPARPPQSAAAAAPASTSVSGTVVSVQGERLVFRRRDGTQQTQTIAPNAKIVRDAKPAKLSDLKEGDLVTVSIPAGRPEIASSVTAVSGERVVVTSPTMLVAAPANPSAVPADRQAAGQAGLGVLVGPGEAGMGVRVIDVDPLGPAAKVGIVPGDLVTSFDKKEVNSPQALIEQIHAKQPGSKVEIAYRRGDAWRNVTATLADRNALAQAGRPPMPGMPGMPLGGFEGQPSARDQHMETLLQQVLSEVQQLRREVQELRGMQAASTTMHNSTPQTERK